MWLRRAYTYVIVDCLAAGQRRYLFRFSETGVKLAKDYLSKHAMHANGAGEVVYAGEFHVAEEGGENVLVLDNNSGLHLPPHLDIRRDCLLRNQMEIPVVGVVHVVPINSRTAEWVDGLVAHYCTKGRTPPTRRSSHSCAPCLRGASAALR
jgi:hypothetical protein